MTDSPSTDPFDQGPERATAGDGLPDAADGPALVLDIDGFEGPIDLLLLLARDQKVDLTRISILQLADQYLAFVETARRLRLELAADYLVMAAWLAYLKSRLLLPDPQEEEPSGEELAAALTFQLQRLEAMQGAAARLLKRPQLGRDVFARGAPEDMPVLETRVHDLTLYDLLKAYGDHKRRQMQSGPLRIAATELYSIEDAIRRMEDILGRLPNWTSLAAFLPPGWKAGGVRTRSALASTFVATLELAKSGRLELRQDGPFSPLYLRTPQP
ncbi:segregation and condensation protein A [Oleisolibacter albus]|uniref:segregation and condensation protein A n=1 Tax=Oleisolibacter albus TaxID=2171757 RepID=UPI000DF2FE19|nr:ScpA family protein [Oleisolibacter albus]